MDARQPIRVILAAIMLSTVLGSIHAFSVFIPQWERLAGASRANVSLIYSTALVALTLAVLFGYQLYTRWQPTFLVLVVGIVASIGLFLSSISTSLFFLYLTYGVLFGGANGLGYGYVLQLAGHASTSHRGLAMALVTAFYAVGATLTPKLFMMLIDNGGNALALQSMGVVVLLVSALAAGILKYSGARFSNASGAHHVPLNNAQKKVRLRLWLAYGCAVAAGLMVIGHAYSIALWANLNTTTAVWATTIVALGNMLGGFSVGFVVDRLSSQRLLRWLPVISSIGLVIMLGWSDHQAQIALVALALIGFSYGAIIAVYPVAVADAYGSHASAKMYGQVFTAWGLAGLLGPWVSGWLFDLTQSYSIALMLAVLLSCVSVLVIRTISVHS